MSNKLTGFFARCCTAWKLRVFCSKPRKFRELGLVHSHCVLVGAPYISVGKKVDIGRYSAITAWNVSKGERLTPEISFGDGCSIGQFAHITAINRISLGKGVLLGKFVTITDNSHGRVEEADRMVPPMERTPYSKGPVDIGDRVWIGDKATILPGVTIGEGAIIGANTVVSKSVPAFTVAAGNPMRIIKQL